MATKRQTEDEPIAAALRHFDDLPESAAVRVHVAAALFGVSVPTVWRWSREGGLPAPSKFGGATVWRVSDLRAALAAAAPARSHRTAAATAAALVAKRNAASAA